MTRSVNSAAQALLAGALTAALLAFLLRGAPAEYAQARTLGETLSGALILGNMYPSTIWILPLNAAVLAATAVLLIHALESPKSVPFAFRFTTSLVGAGSLLMLPISLSLSALLYPPAPPELVRLSSAASVTVTVTGLNTKRVYYDGPATAAQAACLKRAQAPIAADPRMVTDTRYEPLNVRAASAAQALEIRAALDDLDFLERRGSARCVTLNTTGGVTFRRGDILSLMPIVSEDRTVLLP